ncbi:hypothetical protein [Paenibacillus agricola]|uniref:Phage shock protein B n=1 Tax=Paenibacillus agricola TaxID=2716264 RepID=A0ABX0J0T2_9BACL|nr:hypothetical protein [Paenibacillus agricola]NHN29436.1 hypothetical protein [Paenibacillus agricola]
MDASRLSEIEKIAELAEKYGLAVILLMILLIVLLVVGRMLVRGDLVPRHLLERVEEDRDRLQAMLDEERRGIMKPIMDTLSRLKKDDSGDRGG